MGRRSRTQNPHVAGSSPTAPIASPKGTSFSSLLIGLSEPFSPVLTSISEIRRKLAQGLPRQRVLFRRPAFFF